MASYLPVNSRPGRPEIDPDLRDVAHLIHQEYDDQVGTRAVDECLARVAARFAGARVRPFVPLLVGRYVREELQVRLVRS